MKAVGIDIGTTSVCGIVLDVESGSVIKSCTKNSDSFIHSCEISESIQSVDKIIKVAWEILESFIDSDVVVIGVTGQMHGIVYYDANGNAVSPLYTWQDKRGDLPYNGTTYAKYLGSFAGYGNVTDFYNRQNGLVPKGTVGYCTIHDYFVMKLCGLRRALIHSSDAASFGCFDMEKNSFSYDCDITVIPDYHIAGKYKGIPVSIAIGDNQASVLSTLADENDVLINVGTGSQVSVVSDVAVIAENIESRPYVEGKYLVVGSALCGGRAFSLLKDFYAEILSCAVNIDDSEVYKIMDAMLEKVDETTLKVDTRFAGTRSNSTLKGAVTNISTYNFTPAQLTLGVLDGMVSELYEMYELMNFKAKGIVGSGNGVRKNKKLTRIVENRFRGKLKMPAHSEEASLGAAIFALVSVGIFANAKEVQRLIKYQ